MKKFINKRSGWRAIGGITIATVLAVGCPATWPQLAALKGGSTAQAPAAPAEPAADPLGRTTPKGAVLGFLAASHKKNFELAEEYLDARFRGNGSDQLVEQFAVVLDKKLPAKLNLLSEKPEGSLADPLTPNRDVVGKIQTSQGPLDIALERVDDKKAGKVWLFAPETLSAIPGVFDEINTTGISQLMPQSLVVHTVGGVPLFEWMAVLLGVPILWVVAFLLDLLLRWIALLVWRWRSRREDLDKPQVLTRPGRLFLVAVTMLASSEWLWL